MQANLESTEYYKHRYSSVCSIVVFPIFLLLIVAFLFGSYLKTDVVIDGSGVYREVNQQTLKENEVYGLVKEQDVLDLKGSQAVRFTVPGSRKLSSAIKGKIVAISDQPKVIRGQTFYSIKVHLNYENKETKLLKTGMNGKISIITGKETYLQHLERTIF